MKSNVSELPKSGPITMTVRDAIGICQSIQQLPLVYDAKASYALGYIAKHCERPAQEFERARMKLQTEFVVIGEQAGPDGKMVKLPPTVPPEKQVEFGERMEELLNAEVTINRAPIKLSDIVWPKDHPKAAEHPPPSPAVLSRFINVIVE